ncbi:MAG: poly-gamma-glutamate biosynthesis protein PgsC [candidate division WOR-3 bacterium]
MIIETIGLGMLASFFMTETLGLAAGGIVVPGYFALTLHQPLRMVVTLLVAVLVWLVTKLLSRLMLLYGRRLLLLAVLQGYLLGYLTRLISPLHLNSGRLDLDVIGYVIPGLVAYWMNRQGIVETIATLLFAAVITRLVITAISGGAF